MNQTTTERRHHSYSPSSLQLFEACGVFAKRDEVSEKALIGTKQHVVTESGEDDRTLTDAQVAMAAECMEFAKAKLREVLERNIGIKYQEIVEPYLPIDNREWEVAVYDPKTGNPTFVKEECTTGGYADQLFIFPSLGLAILFDWKFGLWPVEEAENNLQGISYVLGVFRKFPGINRVEFYFKLPQISEISHHTFFRKDEDALRLRVQIVVERAEQLARKVDFEKATPRIPACLFCARVGACHKVQDLILQVGKKYHPIEFPDSIDTTLLRDPTNFSKGMRLAQLVTAWAKGYKAQGTQQVLLGRVPVPEGFRLAEYSEREIVDPRKFKEASLKYLSEEEYSETLTPGIGKVEKIISDKAPRGMKEVTVKEFGQVLLDMSAVQKTSPVPYLKAIPKRADPKQQD